jgi:hypothetical protein
MIRVLTKAIALLAIPSLLFAGNLSRDEQLSNLTTNQRLYLDTTRYIAGDSTNSEIDLVGNVNITGNLEFSGLLAQGTQSETVVEASSDTTITPTSAFIDIDANVEAITFTATPLLTAASLEDYQSYIIYCSSNDITLQDADTLSGSGIELTEGTSLTLSAGEWCKFKSIGDVLYQDGFARTLDGNFSTIGTLSAEQLTSTDDLTVTDDASVGGDLSVTGTTEMSTGTVSGMYGLKFLTDGDPTSTPSAVGILMIDTANDCELYISTSTEASGWEKVGAQ